MLNYGLKVVNFNLKWLRLQGFVKVRTFEIIAIENYTFILNSLFSEKRCSKVKVRAVQLTTAKIV